MLRYFSGPISSFLAEDMVHAIPEGVIALSLTCIDFSIFLISACESPESYIKKLLRIPILSASRLSILLAIEWNVPKNGTGLDPDSSKPSSLDTLERISELYYGTADRARDLRRFNDLTADRLQRGQVILVPLPDLLLSEEGRARVASATGTPPAGGEVRALQARIETQLPGLLEHLRRGRYTETVALGNRLLGRDELTGNQIVTIERALAVAYARSG